MSAPLRKPESLIEEIELGCEQLGLELARPQVVQLHQYLEQLAKWGKVFNLTAVTNPSQMVTVHLMDCLALVASIRKISGSVSSRPLRILDVGSGAGLPALVLAITANDQLPLEVFSVDPVEKKIAFQRQQQALLRLNNFTPFHAQVEQLHCGQPNLPPRWSVGEPMDLITCRAFASLTDFTNASMHLLSVQDKENSSVTPGFVAMKAKLDATETAALAQTIEVTNVETLQVPGLDAQRCLVWMKHKTNTEQAGAATALMKSLAN